MARNLSILSGLLISSAILQTGLAAAPISHSESSQNKARKRREKNREKFLHNKQNQTLAKSLISEEEWAKIDKREADRRRNKANRKANNSKVQQRPHKAK